jgi:hypothetical protein
MLHIRKSTQPVCIIHYFLFENFDNIFKKKSRNDDASDLEPEATVPKTSSTGKVALPKISKKIGPLGYYKKNINNSFLTTLY